MKIMLLHSAAHAGRLPMKRGAVPMHCSCPGHQIARMLIFGFAHFRFPDIQVSASPDLPTCSKKLTEDFVLLDPEGLHPIGIILLPKLFIAEDLV
jgi:hypothetical protein